MFTFISPRNCFRRAALIAVMAAFGLAACSGSDGYGGGGGGSPTAGAGSKLFAADSPDRAIGSLVNPNPSAGSIVVDRIIMGPFYTQLSNNISSLALDTTNDRLYVGNGTSILVFNGASMANGDVSPARAIGPIGNTGSLFLDTANDRLYVGDDASGVKVFNGASTANSTLLTPSRSITGNFGTTFSIHGVAVDAVNNVLYVSNSTLIPSSSHQISVFNNASAANGTRTPDRTITPTISTSNVPIAGIFLDAALDRLYVSSSQGGTYVMVFNNASARNGPITPDRTIVFPTLLSSVVLDTVSDRLYAVSPVAIYVLSSASTATGPVAATGILVPANGSFTAVAVSP